jgi:hypothetical protein
MGLEGLPPSGQDVTRALRSYWRIAQYMTGVYKLDHPYNTSILIADRVADAAPRHDQVGPRLSGRFGPATGAD